MSRKCIDVVGFGESDFVKIYRDSESNEFVARLYEAGKLNAKCDYFESFNKYDRQSVREALWSVQSTAERMLR